MVAAAKSNLKRVTLELGGKSPLVIWKDANGKINIFENNNYDLLYTWKVFLANVGIHLQKKRRQSFFSENIVAFDNILI